MTETTGKKLGDCRKRLCENNVNFNVMMNIQVIAEVEGFSFGHPFGQGSGTNAQRSPHATTQSTSFSLLGSSPMWYC